MATLIWPAIRAWIKVSVDPIKTTSPNTFLSKEAFVRGRVIRQLLHSSRNVADDHSVRSHEIGRLQRQTPSAIKLPTIRKQSQAA